MVQCSVFSRIGSKGMDNRIRTLTGMLHNEERFIDYEYKFDLNYLLSIKNIDYEKDISSLKKMQEVSYGFIDKALRE